MRQNVVEKVARDAQRFWERGWAPGTGGNLSVRDPKDDTRQIITASGTDLGRAKAEDFVEADLEGSAVQTADTPSAEAPVHGAIYRALSEVGAVYHVHHLEAVLCSQQDSGAGSTTFQNVEMIKALGFWEQDDAVAIPIVTNEPDLAELATGVARAIKKPPADERPPAVMVEGHGFYAWGEDPDAARRHTEALAWLYEWSWERRR
jgi:methylthioribulose-1-phosphate dehydratase